MWEQVNSSAFFSQVDTMRWIQVEVHPEKGSQLLAKFRFSCFNNSEKQCKNSVILMDYTHPFEYNNI